MMGVSAVSVPRYATGYSSMPGLSWPYFPAPGRALSPVVPLAPVASTGDIGAINRFAVMGDAGTGDQGQMKVAHQLENCRQALPFASMLVLGDNVYPNGEPNLFEDRIRRPYSALQAQGVRFFPVLGNHDVKKGFGDLQLAYWGVPECYNFKLGSPDRQVEFWGLDTTVLVPGSNGVQSPEAKRRAAVQLNWLKQSLAQSKAGFKVVYGHYPLYSKGGLVKASRAQMQHAVEKILSPIFNQYGVDAYIAGHEHHYEKPRNVNGVWYVVSGSGGKLDDIKRGGAEGNGLLKRRHFMLFEILPQGLAYRTISEHGELLDAGLIPKKPPRNQGVGVVGFPVPFPLPNKPSTDFRMAFPST